MAKAKAKNGSKAVARKGNKPRTGMVGSRGRTLDVFATQYARLLRDPCNAPVVHPVYSGADAGFLFRAESVLTLGVDRTAGFFHWTPGYVNANGSEVVGGTELTSGVNLTMAAFGGATPGKAFLTTNAFGVRCVAACLKVVYPGSEQARAGRVHYGHTQASLADVGDAGYTADGYALSLQNYSRTPPESIELIWRPGNADQEFNDPTASSVAALRDRKSALSVAWSGLPTTGLTFYLTAVYEWTPKPAIGVSTNATGKNPSVNSLDQVVDAIQASGFNWVNHGHQAGGLVAGMSALYGRMSARPTRTKLGFY